MRRWAVALGVLVGVVIGVVAAMRLRPAPITTAPAQRSVAVVLHQVIARETVRVDLFLPKPGASPAPWMVFAHERGWPAPDEKEREGAALADAMQRRGIAVAVVSFEIKEGWPITRAAEEVAEVVRELARRAPEHGIAAEPVLAGDELGASLVTLLALSAAPPAPTPPAPAAPAKIRGVIGMNGVYDDVGEPRADAPPFLLLSAHGDSPKSAQSSRAFARALERVGAKDVRSHHVSARDTRALSNLSGDRNEVGDLVAAFVRGEPTPGGAEGAWAVAEKWSARAPLSSEPFWTGNERLVVRHPVDVRLRAQMLRIFGETMRDLEPWPAVTYDAIDLGDYLRAHPELGTGDWLEVTNVRGEKLVISRSEIERTKPRIVVGIDDEKNLFRLFVTYNVYRTYSWKPETEVRPLLVRTVGAFLHVPTDAGTGAALHTLTLADFALTIASFRVVADDPLAAARKTPKAVAAVLTNEQGCLQCHALRGAGARAHHLRATDGKLAEGFGLALEEYPPEVLRRFLFEQKDVAKTFGVGPLEVSPATATELLAEVARH